MSSNNAITNVRRVRWQLLPLAIGVAVIGGSACAMSPGQDQAWTCTVENAAKLPAEAGDAESVCAAMKEAAVAAAGPSLLNSGAVSVRVTVESQHKLSAVAIVGGRALPEQKLAISDRVLSPGSIEMLARAVANQLANSR